jgi:predicted NAD/FAD-binding protein
VVGSGIAGLACAHLLDPHHDIVLFEADSRLGGHTNTIEVTDPHAGRLGVDTGFIVHNDRNYPNLTRLFDDLGVATIDTEMSFAVTDRGTGLTYRATNLDTLLADRRNILDRRLWRMLADIARFHRGGHRFLRDPDPSLTLARFLEQGRYSDAFVDLYLVPMGASIWSADPTTFDQYPAATYLRFLDNHGLLSFGDRPQWRTVAGGSRRYVDAIVERFTGQIRLSAPATAIRRTEDGVELTHPDGTDSFDQVILACHSDQALSALEDPSREEKEVLGAIRFQPNRATLHTDTLVLPPRRKAWAAWNYDRQAPTPDGHRHQDRAVLTYDLTTLQRLPGSRRYLVSLNADEQIEPSSVLASFDYSHPVFDRAAVEAQGRLDEINGQRDTWFCGAWTRYGFHEDGMASAVAVSRRLGATW